MSFYFLILDLPRPATMEELRRAYKKQALKWHPDKNPNGLEYSTQRFKAISEAYEALATEYGYERALAKADRPWVPVAPPMPNPPTPQLIVRNIRCLYCKNDCAFRLTHHGSRAQCMAKCGRQGCHDCSEFEKDQRRRTENPDGYRRRQQKKQAYMARQCT